MRSNASYGESFHRCHMPPVWTTMVSTVPAGAWKDTGNDHGECWPPAGWQQ